MTLISLAQQLVSDKSCLIVEIPWSHPTRHTHTHKHTYTR